LHRAAFSASPGKPAGYQCLLDSPHLFFALAQCLQVGSAQATCASVEVNAPCQRRHLARIQTQNTWHIAACAALRADPSPEKCLGTSMSIKQLKLTIGWNIADMQAHSAQVQCLEDFSHASHDAADDSAWDREYHRENTFASFSRASSESVLMAL